MSVLLRLAAGCALLAACKVDISSKTSCNVDADCLPGDVCRAKRCGSAKGGSGTGGGGTGGGSTSGSAGTNDAGGDVPPPRMCPTSLVNACPADADAGTRCEQTYCGGRLSQYGIMNQLLVNYRILDPDNKFSDSYRAAIRAGAAAWGRVSDGFVTLKDCDTLCTGKFIDVVPGDEDGLQNPDDPEPRLPMPADSGGRVSPHRIAHQWGHALGLSHTYQRADRDRYMGFDPVVWCASGGAGLPPLCAAGPGNPPGLPAVTTGTFGVFDGKSKMNGLRSEGICGTEEPDEGSGEPTIGDISALAELFFGAYGAWSPFRPVSPDQGDYQLAPGVDPTGSPQIAEVDYANPEIFVRGTDDHIYTTTRSDLLTSQTATWNQWTMPFADDVDADPSVVFAWLASPPTLFLTVRSKQDGQIYLRARRGTTWGDRISLGAPSVGAASAPALAVQSPDTLAVFVRGGDGLIYWLSCSDATDDCAVSVTQNAWTALPPPPSPPGIFVGKPAALWPLDNSGLTVAAVRDTRAVFMMRGLDTGVTSWAPVNPITSDLAPDDPGIAIAIRPEPGYLDFFGRNSRHLLVDDTALSSDSPIGGVLASPPAAVAIHYSTIVRTDVTAIIDDHGHPGVWWRYHDPNYQAPCYYNSPMTCLTCGLP